MTRWLAVGVFSMAVATSVAAHAQSESKPTKQQCISENETGQDARLAGRLLEAERLFASCAVESCPGLVREDCLRRLQDVQRATPMLVLLVKDDEGRLVSGASVSIDDVPVGERRQGAVIHADPGPHTFRVTADGYSPATKNVVLQEGVSGEESVVLTRRIGPIPSASPASEVAGAPASTEVAPSKTQKTLSYVLMGAGVLGLGIGGVSTLVASGAHDDAIRACGGGRSCPNETATQNAATHERTADGWATGATVSIVAGAALLVGGLVLFFTAPKPPSRVATVRR